MFFIGILTDKNSENNIKSFFKDKLNNNEMIFLNGSNLENFRNVKFDSLVINNKVEDKYLLNKIIDKSRYVLYNSDIEGNSKPYNGASKFISYGYSSKANVTISSVTDDNYLLYMQGFNNDLFDMQEVKFEKKQKNINVYDGMIVTIINLIYKK